MIEDKKGAIWFTHSEPNPIFENTPNQVLYRYNPSPNGKIDSNNFTRILEKYEPNDFQIFGKTADREGNIWFGTMHGTCMYDGITFTYFRN